MGKLLKCDYSQKFPMPIQPELGNVGWACRPAGKATRVNHDQTFQVSAKFSQGKFALSKETLIILFSGPADSFPPQASTLRFWQAANNLSPGGQ